MVTKVQARHRRFWHCLFGMFTGHRMTDLYNCEQECFTGRPYREVLVEMGCACGRVFWRAMGSDVQKRRRAAMPDYDKKLKDWLS